MTTPVYAVTGASGRLGRLAVEQLTAHGVLPPDIVALVCMLTVCSRPAVRGAVPAPVDRGC